MKVKRMSFSPFYMFSGGKQYNGTFVSKKVSYRIAVTKTAYSKFYK